MISALLPLAQAPEGMAAVSLMLRGRYDVRGGFLVLSMALRLMADRRRRAHRPHVDDHRDRAGAGGRVGGDRRGGTPRLPPLPSSRAPSAGRGRARDRSLHPAVERRNRRRVAARDAHADAARHRVDGESGRLLPRRAVAADGVQRRLCADQARDARASRRATGSAARAIACSPASADTRCSPRSAPSCSCPLLLVFMPQIVRLLFVSKNLGAVNAARIIVAAGAVQFVVGWSKSFAVTVGRPQLRIWTHGIETAVLLPLAVRSAGVGCERRRRRHARLERRVRARVGRAVRAHPAGAAAGEARDVRAGDRGLST